MTKSLLTPKTLLTWSEDGSRVTKRTIGDVRDPVLGSYRRAVINEVRFNRLLLSVRPPVRFPALLSA